VFVLFLGFLGAYIPDIILLLRNNKLKTNN